MSTLPGDCRNHWAQRQAEKAGIGFTPLDNAFAAADDVPALQAICDSLGEDHIRALLAKWLRILPYPFTKDDTAAGYRYASIVQAEFSLTQMLDRPVTGRIFLEQMIRDNLDIGRPDKISLIFGRRIHNGRKRPTRSEFRTRIVTDNVTPAVRVEYKKTKVKQYHLKEGRALRTETVINDPGDFGIGKGLANLPALRQVGFTASRRLLSVQKISHDPAAGAAAITAITSPVITPSGTRIPGLRFTDERVQARLSALCAFRLLPNGFTNRELRTHLAPLFGRRYEDMTSGQITYDLRRLRVHGLIERIPRTHRYQVTNTGLRHALFLTRLHARFLRPGLGELTSQPPARPRTPARRRPRLPKRARRPRPPGRTRRLDTTAPDQRDHPHQNLTRSWRLRPPKKPLAGPCPRHAIRCPGRRTDPARRPGRRGRKPRWPPAPSPRSAASSDLLRVNPPHPSSSSISRPSRPPNGSACAG